MFPHSGASFMPRMIALKCPSCDAPLEAPEDRSRFFCHFCGTPIEREQAPQVAIDAAPRTPLPRAVPIPSKLHVEELGDELTIRWRWFSPAVFFLLPFCIAWNAFLVGWYSLAFGNDMDMPGAMRLVFLIFPLAHVAVGVGLAYAVLIMLLNSTTVNVQRGELLVRHGPIPSPGNATIPVDDIEQIYCGVDISKGSKGKPGVTYPLRAMLKSGRVVDLLPRNSEHDVARAVEHLIERHLGIEDRVVSGEHRA
jgi:predicted RNA-binding Zn-ribbon protein involved in translation (DUF1610 family)